jgi:hypothetical protein
MFWPRLIPAVVAAMALAVIGGKAEPQLAAAHRVALAAAIDPSSTTVGLADSNLARLTTQGEIDKQLDMMQSIGVQNVRIGLSWLTIERQKGVYDFSATDYVVQQAYKRGMGVLAVLHETPRWAGDPVLSGQPDPVAFGQFAGKVAEHYGGKISAVEVWNEPNAKFFLNPVDPASYTEMLKAAYTAIKNVTKVTGDDITVIGGVLGSGRTIDDAQGNVITMNPVEFLAGMYAAGAHGYFDALSFHPYKYDMKFSEQADQIASPLQQLWHMRDLMQIFGDEDLKIWASEYGLPTDPYNPNLPGQYISPEQQAAYIKDFLNSWSKQEGTGPMFIYSTRDLNTGSPSDGDNFGIWETDWTAKPAVDVIREFIADQNGHPIFDFIRNAIVNLAKFTGAVINGIVNVTVDVVTALVDATVWVVKAIAKGAAAVARGIAEVAQRIATAVCNTVQAVVNRVKDFFDRDTTTTATSLTAARVTDRSAAVTADDTRTVTAAHDTETLKATPDVGSGTATTASGQATAGTPDPESSTDEASPATSETDATAQAESPEPPAPAKDSESTKTPRAGTSVAEPEAAVESGPKDTDQHDSTESETTKTDTKTDTKTEAKADTKTDAKAGTKTGTSAKPDTTGASSTGAAAGQQSSAGADTKTAGSTSSGSAE